MRKVKWFVLAAVAVLLVLLPVSAQAAEFGDISGHWAKADIEDAVDRGLFSGTSDDMFSPNAPMTRGMFVTVLCRADDGWYDEDADFADVKESDWFYDSVCWASENGLVTGTDSRHFSPNQNITREQMVTILYRYLDYYGGTLERTTNVRPLFYDRDSISAFARDAVEEMQFAQIIKGKPDGAGYRFDPQGKATRAEAARVFCTFLDSIHYDEAEGETPVVDSSDALLVGSYIRDVMMDIETVYWGDDGYMPLTDLPKVLGEMEDMAKALIKDGIITKYEVNKDNITVKLKAGPTYIYEPDVREYAESASNSDSAGTVRIAADGSADTGASVQTYEPYYSSDDRFYEYQNKERRIDDLASDLHNADNTYAFTKNYDEDKTTVEAVKNWSANSVVIWMGHGAYSDSIGSVLFTGEMLTDSNYSKYKADLDADRLVCSEDNRLAVTPAFFKYYFKEKSLSGSVFWLGTCQSHQDSRLADALIGKGASTVVGSSWKIYIPYMVSMTKHFFSRLSTKDAAGTFYSAGDALEYAKKNAFWPTDSFFFAEMQLQGDSQFRLGKLTGSISGTVTDKATGKAISGVKVYTEGSTQSVTTDANGKYTISGLSTGSTYKVITSMPGYTAQSQSVSIFPSTNTGSGNFALVSSNGKISVKLQPDSNAVINGTVTVYKLSGQSSSGDYSSAVSEKIKTQSIVGSTFTIEGLENGVEYKLDIQTNNYADASCRVYAAQTPVTKVVNITATKAQTKTVQVKVTDAQGSVLGGAMVKLSGATVIAGNYMEITSGKTDSSGLFQTVVSNSYTAFKAEASLDGYASGSVTNQSGTSITIKLEKTAAVQPGGNEGSGTTEPDIPAGFTPIYTVAQFNALTGSEKVILMNDISGADIISSWSGVLDGNGHTVSSPKMYGIYEGSTGWIGENIGVIRNLRLRSISCRSEYTGYTAVIVMNFGTVENCVVESGAISVSGSGTAWAGGLVGSNGVDGVIKNCVNNASVSVNMKINAAAGTNSNAYAAGIAAYNYGSIEHCLNLGSISAGSDRLIGISGVANDSHAAGTNSYGTTADCGNGGSLSAGFSSSSGLETNLYQDIVSVNAKNGYAVNTGSESGLTQVSLSELKAMWRDLI